MACWFEQMIEFGDASNEEAPLPNPKKRELMKSAQLQMISMLQGMDTDNGLKQGSITTIAKSLTWHTAWFTDCGNMQHTCMPWA